MIVRSVILVAIGIFYIGMFFSSACVASHTKPAISKSSDIFNYIWESESNPVIPCGSLSDWDHHIREIGNILYEPDDIGREYKLIYSGYRGDYEENDVYIGYAFSSDGESWTKYGKIISHPAEDPYVIKVGDTYYLYAEDKADTPFRNIRRWHGLNFINWVDDGVVLAPRWWSWWESKDVSSPVVWREEQTWYMLYEGRGGRKNIFAYFSVIWHSLLTSTVINPGGKIGVATSADGIRWIRHQSNPVFIGSEEEGDFDRYQVVSDDIVKIGDTYYLSYHGWSGLDWTSGIGKSGDLISWTRGDSPINSSPTIMIFHNGKDYVAYYYFNDSSGIYRGYLRQ